MYGVGEMVLFSNDRRLSWCQVQEPARNEMPLGPLRSCSSHHSGAIRV